MNFSQPKIFGFTAQFHLQNFSVSRDKTIWIEIVIPAHSLSQNVFDVRNQWNTKGFPYDFIGTVQKVNSDGKSWYSASTFIYEFFATESFRIYRTESFTYKFFQSCETKHFGWKNVIPAHSLSQTLFDTQNHWKSKGFPYEFFQLWTTSKFRRKLLIPSPLFIYKIFR